MYLNLTARDDWSSTLPASHLSYFYRSINGSLILTQALGIESDILNYAKPRDAIKTSFEQYGISSSQYATNIAQQNVQYNPSDFKKSIGEQKWIALFGQGLEAFTEWRRLDYPQLSPAVAGTLEGKMPLRFFYPGNEQSLNGKSYQTAIAKQGADELTTRLWFDVQ